MSLLQKLKIFQVYTFTKNCVVMADHLLIHNTLYYYAVIVLF